MGHVVDEGVEIDEKGMAGLGEDLVKARAAYQHTQAYDEALFGEDFSAQ